MIATKNATGVGTNTQPTQVHRSVVTAFFIGAGIIRPSPRTLRQANIQELVVCPGIPVRVSMPSLGNTQMMTSGALVVLDEKPTGVRIANDYYLGKPKLSVSRPDAIVETRGRKFIGCSASNNQLKQGCSTLANQECAQHIFGGRETRPSQEPCEACMQHERNACESEWHNACPEIIIFSDGDSEKTCREDLRQCGPHPAFGTFNNCPETPSQCNMSDTIVDRGNNVYGCCQSVIR